ncbi:hypothetical protein LUZ60_002727 [Juncus effusus]|nr:hypothetical protein LUZ60_002727 [Juncus effusus]
MSSLFLFVSVIISLHISTANGQSPLIEFISPNFTASDLLFLDFGGKFLTSRNATFAAAISQPGKSTGNYYFCIIHVASDMIVWTANRNFPMLEGDFLILSSSGLSIVAAYTHPIIWKTPTLRAPVAMMRLLENGNLVLLDNERRTLWQSFDYPTDTILSGLSLPVGSVLRSSSVNQSDLSDGDYELQVIENDLILTWYGQSYWTMSNDVRAILSSRVDVVLLEFNITGLYLLGEDRVVLSITVDCSCSFLVAVFNSSGMLNFMCFMENQWLVQYSMPDDLCTLPLACGTLGVCRAGACNCAEPLENTDHGCLPPNGHLQNLTGISCQSTLEVSSVRYMKVGLVNYFGSVRDERWNQVTSHNIEVDTFFIPGLPTKFTYEKLFTATNGFTDLIGQGGFGKVYRGTLLVNGSTADVAVKLVNKVSNQDRKVFYSEVAIMINIRHINLVKLHGFCLNKTNKLLVSEFVSRGSLDKVLFGDNYVLNWAERVRIAIGTAAGLAYLHHGCSPRIIHLDVKPENILLTENFHAKVSDFGLSQLMDSNRSKTFTLMKGTRGYLAPEWLTNGGVSPKTDVYSYGMLLLEIINGRRNTFYEEDTGRMVYFPALAVRMHNRGLYMEMVDRRLECRVEPDQAERLVKTALCCLHLMPNLRPSMADVVNILAGEMPILEPQFEALRYLKGYERDGSLNSSVQQENNVDELQLFSLSSFSMKELSGPR